MPLLLNPQFTEDDHRYTDEAGNVYPSVTEIIGQYWPIDRRFYQESGTLRGSDVHSLTAYMDQSIVDPEAAAAAEPNLRPYLVAWDSFKRDMVDGPDGFYWIEQKFIDTDLGYAGTADRVARFKDGRVFVLDIKTGAPESWHELQQGAYAVAARRDDLDVDGLATVQLMKSGKYKLIPHKLDRGVSAWVALIKWSNYRREMKR